MGADCASNAGSPWFKTLTRLADHLAGMGDEEGMVEGVGVR